MYIKILQLKNFVKNNYINFYAELFISYSYFNRYQI